MASPRGSFYASGMCLPMRFADLGAAGAAFQSVRKNTHRAGGFSVFLLKWRSRLAGGASRPPGPSGRGAEAIFEMIYRRLYLKKRFCALEKNGFVLSVCVVTKS